MLEQLTIPLEDQIRIGLNGHDVTPTQRSFIGSAACFVSTEKRSQFFSDCLKSSKPDGYLVGIGVGTILSLIRGFTRESPPKGIVMVDINPHIVAMGKVFIDELARSKSMKGLVTNFFKLGAGEYHKKTEFIIRNDLQLADCLRQWTGDFPQSFFPIRFWGRALEDAIENKNIVNVPKVIDSRFNTFRELAQQGKMVVLHADFTNHSLIDSIRQLSDFQTSRNIIYLTNTLDFVRGSYTSPLSMEDIDVTDFSNLRAYSKTFRSPVFVSAPLASEQKLILHRTFDQMALAHISELNPFLS